MIRLNKMKKGLKQGHNYIGTFAKMADPSVVELFATCGFDFFIVDNEHSQMSKESMVNLVRTSDISGIIPIVRIRQNNRSMILQGLDAGALGIMVPETNTRADIEELITNAYYKPLGNRGYTASSRAAGYGAMNAAEYARMANENIITIAYCEMIEAIENLDEMLKVPNLDVMWIGPMDLSQAFGVTGEPGHPKVKEATQWIIKKTLAAGVAVGTIASDITDTRALIDQGVQVICLSSDQAMIARTGKQFMQELSGCRK
jgi:4-hydroxy-2-oxoheptanedioate aldolase